MNEPSQPEKRRRPFRIESGALRVHRDVDEEMEFHLSMRTQKLIKLGLSPDAARDEALKQFGDVATVRTECISIDREYHRVMNRRNHLQDLRQDVSFAFRALGKNKGFAFVTVLILALGIGANTAMFSLIDALLLRKLNVGDPSELVLIGDPARVGSTSQGSPSTENFSAPLFYDLRDNSKTLSGVFATGRAGRLDVMYERDGKPLAEPDHPTSRAVSGSYFSVLQLQPAMGRFFLPTEDRAPGDAAVVVVGYDYWKNRLGADASMVGRTIRINNIPFTIVGVAPEGFRGEVVDRTIDMYVPLSMHPILNPNTDWLSKRNVSWLLVMGRQKPGATLAQVQSETRQILNRSLIEHANADEARGLEEHLKEHPIPVQSGSQGLSFYRGMYKKSLYTLMAAVGLVLLVVCANVANLLLARATARSREMSVRMALGAKRLRLVQQLLTESLIIAIAGGAFGILIAVWASQGLLRLANGTSGNIVLDTSIDARLLAFSAGVSLLTALLFGLLPAFRATRVELATALRSSGRNVAGTGGKFSTGRMLVVAQVAMSVTLLVGTGMLLRSLQQLNNADVGADREHLVVASIGAQRLGYGPERVGNMMRELVNRVKAIPGVVDASVSENGIFSGTESRTDISVEGYVARTSADSNSVYDEVGPRYFGTVGARIVRGRDFEDRDNVTGAKVAIINETMAKHFFPDGNAIGRHITSGTTSREIVGVVADINGTGLREKPVSRFYVGMMQSERPDPNFYLQIRTTGDPARLTNAIRAAMLAVEPSLPISRLSSLSELIRDSVAQDRLMANVVSMFGALTLILSSLGLYGVMAYATTRRTSEFGLRLALGAIPGSIIRMVLRDALVLTVVGLVVGIPLAYAMSRVLRDQFFGIEAFDLPSVVTTVAILVATATLAAYLPAMRAAKVAPLDALRAE